MKDDCFYAMAAGISGIFAMVDQRKPAYITKIYASIVYACCHSCTQVNLYKSNTTRLASRCPTAMAMALFKCAQAGAPVVKRTSVRKK